MVSELLALIVHHTVPELQCGVGKLIQHAVPSRGRSAGLWFWFGCEMDDFSSISLLSLAMLVGCYVAGTIPLAVNFSEVSSAHSDYFIYSSGGYNWTGVD